MALTISSAIGFMMAVRGMGILWRIVKREHLVFAVLIVFKLNNVSAFKIT